MILIIADVVAKLGMDDRLESAFRDYVARMDKEGENGILHFDILRNGTDDEGRQRFVYREAFENDAAMDRHNAAPYKAGYVTRMREFIASAGAQQFVSREWR